MGFQNIGKFAAGIANKLDTSGAFVASVQRGMQDEVTSKVVKKSGDILFNEEVQGIQRNATQAIYNRANRIGGAASGAAMTGVAGAVNGAVIGGVSGAVEDDESVLSGALKGAAIGGAIGTVGGGISGYAHANGNILMNADTDYKAIAAKISKWQAEGKGKQNIARNINTFNSTYEK